MTPLEVLGKLAFAIFRLVVLLGSIAAGFYFFAISVALITNNPIGSILMETGMYLVACTIISTILTLLNPKTFSRAGPLGIVAPFMDFEKPRPLLTLLARSNSVLFWAYIALFSTGDVTTMPTVFAAAYLLTMPFSWQHASVGIKHLKETGQLK